jgi:hypothetical protein
MTDADLFQLHFLLRKFLELMVQIFVRGPEILLYILSLNERVTVVPQLPLCKRALDVNHEKCRRTDLALPHVSRMLLKQCLANL